MHYELFRLLHFAAIFCFAGALVIENMAIKPQISGEDARNLANVDRICGVSAVLVLVFGLSLWLWVGKPSEFYTANSVFHAKLGLFALMAICATYPTVFFAKNRISEKEFIDVPSIVRLLLRFQLILLVLIPLLAVLMARGVGISA